MQKFTINGFGGGGISLAADGSLWYWPLGSANELGITPVVELSHQPQLNGNVFTAASH
ncbi:MAG TPA: hypothetical protein VL970_15290 [Candidatus Acidoferrales bacterium]|nr:hypothetical protein [Candidatus Acidoferrales bacterium]